MDQNKRNLQHARLIVFLIILGTFGVMNVAFYSSQELGNSAERNDFENLKVKLSELKSEVDTIEPKVHSAEERLKAAQVIVNQCKSRIDQFESQAIAGSLPSSIYSQYTLAIESCNAHVKDSNNLVSEYNSLYNEYDRLISLHNTLVLQTNELAKSLGNKSYIIPVPFLRRVP